MTPVASVAFKKRWIDRLVWALMLNTTTVYSSIKHWTGKIKHDDFQDLVPNYK